MATAYNKLRRRVRCNETGEVFESCRDADRALNATAGSVDKYLRGKIKHVKGYTFTDLGLHKGPNKTFQELILEQTAGQKEIWRPVVGYEKEYLISNKANVQSAKFPGRSKKITTRPKTNQQVVVLSKNNVPHAFSLSALYNAAWNGQTYKSKNIQKKSVPVRCLDDDKDYDCMLAASSRYHIPYTEFRKSLSGVKKAVIRGRTFVKIQKMEE